MPRTDEPPLRAIVSFHRDEERHWFARLECGHHQHTRHDPPWVERPWVESEAGRRRMIGHRLACKKCLDGAPPDPAPDFDPSRHEGGAE
ncbi:DUF3565 domain-containing protein [Guyparkeria sp.]|uniref:DUF3565 domain-containing protein n=1 Tax=Guyparkeria sp. TaxID=2035736 RepID=UPI003971090E